MAFIECPYCQLKVGNLATHMPSCPKAPKDRGSGEGARKGGTRASGVERAKSETDARTVPSPKPRPLLGLAPLVIESPFVPKRGRPLSKDKDKTLTAKEPWKVEGMSKATWYRRQKEKSGG